MQQEMKKELVEETKGEFDLEGPINEQSIDETSPQLNDWQGLEPVDPIEPRVKDSESEDDEGDEDNPNKEGLISRIMNKIFFDNSIGRDLFPQLKVLLMCKE